MDAKSAVSVIDGNRLDGLDRERFRDMLASPPFALFRERVAAEWERARETCSSASDPQAIYRAQGKVDALRVVLALPETIMAEFDRKPRKRST